MSRNGPLALGFHGLVVVFMMAPLVVVCLVAFTPENTLSLPTSGFSLRWFRAVFERADFIPGVLQQPDPGIYRCNPGDADCSAGGACDQPVSVPGT